MPNHFQLNHKEAMQVVGEMCYIFVGMGSPFKERNDEEDKKSESLSAGLAPEGTIYSCIG